MRDAANTPAGGVGGDDFNVRPTTNSVKALSIWVDRGTANPDRDLVKAIGIIWTDGGQYAVGKKIGVRSDIIFDDDEKVTAMSLWTGGRVDQICITTDKDRTFHCGGKFGYQQKQDVGNGTLLGFDGSANEDELVSIGAVFAQDG